VCNLDQPGGGLCNKKWQYLYKVLGKCFTGYIYRNIVQYCTWYNHSIRIRYNAYIGTLAHAFSVRVSFPEVQFLVEARRTDLQIAWPQECAVDALSAMLKRTETITQAGVGSHTIRSVTIAFILCVAHICASVTAITVRFRVLENTTCKGHHPRELICKVTAEFACKSTSRGLRKERYCRNDVTSGLKCM